MRGKRTIDVISNVKWLKLQVWEMFGEKIRKDKEKDLNQHIDRGIFCVFNSAVSNAVPAIIILIILMSYKWSGGPIATNIILTVMSLFNQLQFLLLLYTLSIDPMANGKQSIRLLYQYLCQEELSQYIQNYLLSVDGGGHIEMMKVQHGDNF